MHSGNILDCDDLGEALREGRPLRRARSYRILFAQGDVDFRPLTVADPVPLGRQILEAADLKPEAGYSLVGILPSGDFEDVRLNEPFDLRQKGAERFISFLTDRTFKLTLNAAQVEWGKPVISGAVLYELAKLGENEAVYLEVQGGIDRLIDPAEAIDLTEPGVERFITAPKAVLRDRDHRQFPTQDGSGSQGDLRTDRSDRFSRAACRQCRLFHDLSSRRIQAACRRVGRGRERRSQAGGDDFQCHPNCSVVVPT